MYVTHTIDEHRRGLRLPEDYSVDGFLCYGTYNPGVLDAQLVNVLAGVDNATRTQLEHPFLRNVQEIKIGQKVLWVTFAYGGAQLSEQAHLASMFGSQANILVGSCGGLKRGIKAGDIILPTSSYSRDSSARLYSRESDDHVSDGALSDTLAQVLSSNEVPVWREPIVTCQAMLGESQADVDHWSQQGYAAVEMEASTLFAVSSHFGVPSAALLYVGDNLIENQTNLSADFAAQAAMRTERQELLFRSAFMYFVA